uniref:DUF7866 domain-containing protein n=1 Tax=Saccharum hybrid cultivar R570 TaxID=131158 RepID=A0A059PZ46_9POAL|nr:hypothetical protein SHCRBa_050_A17_F_240 [Saccharum hybrid cultivar R570]
MATRGAPIISLILLLLLLLSFALQAQGGSGKLSSRRPSASASQEEEYVPVKSVVYRPSSSVLLAAVSYEPFELCQGCRCCSSSNASSCVDTSCCYAIDCYLPGKPFGTCAFTPHTCGCGAAAATANCTQPS